MQDVSIKQKIITYGDGDFFFRIFGFIFIVFAVLLLCRAFSLIHTAVTQNKETSTLNTLSMYVRTACERTPRVAKRMCLPTCFLLKHVGGTLGIIKSPVCNYNHKKTIFNHGPLSASHNFMCFSFLSEAPCIKYYLVVIGGNEARPQ